MRVGLVLIGVTFVLLGILSLTLADGERRAEENAPRLIEAQERQIREGLRDPSDVSSRSWRDSPYIGPVGLNSPASLMGRGALLLIAGTGILLRQRWAMLLGIPLLLVIVVASRVVPDLLKEVREFGQPGSFAAIGIPLFGLIIVLAVVAATVLLRAALVPRQEQVPESGGGLDSLAVGREH